MSADSTPSSLLPRPSQALLPLFVSWDLLLSFGACISCLSSLHPNMLFREPLWFALEGRRRVQSVQRSYNNSVVNASYLYLPQFLLCVTHALVLGVGIQGVGGMLGAVAPVSISCTMIATPHPLSGVLGFFQSCLRFDLICCFFISFLELGIATPCFSSLCS